MKITLISFNKDESVIFKLQNMDQTTVEVELAIDDYDLTENAFKYLATFYTDFQYEAKAIAKTLKVMMMDKDNESWLDMVDMNSLEFPKFSVDQIKQQRYTDESGQDLIDKWEERYSIEEFRLIMWVQMEKYNERLGKKDAPEKEVAKIADYANRWLQAEKRAIK